MYKIKIQKLVNMWEWYIIASNGAVVARSENLFRAKWEARRSALRLWLSQSGIDLVDNE